MNPSKLVGVRELIVKYDIFFIDLWGVIHNGKKIFENAIEVLKNIKNHGKVIVLISNAPRPSTTVKSFLLKMGFDFSLIDELVTSGDVTRNYLEENKIKKFYHLGPDKDRDIFNQNNQLSKNIQDCDEIICTGLNNAEEEIEIYDRLLKENIKYKKKMICANPDEVVSRGTKLEYCAGKIAQIYSNLGGEVLFFGKPFVSIYSFSLDRIKNKFPKIEFSTRHKILAVGDNLKTDIKGANNFNIDSMLILNGIYKDYDYNNNFDFTNLCKSNNVENVYSNFYQKDLKW